MNRSTAKIIREYGPFPGVDRVNGVTYDGPAGLVCLRRQAERLGPCEREGRCAPSMSRRMQERPSTAGTCFSSPRTASRRSIPTPVVCSPPSRRPAAAATRGSPGLKVRYGWGSTGSGKSIKSIPTQGRFFAPSSPNRFVTGVTWIDGDLWHATWQGDESELRRNRSPNGRGAAEARYAARDRRVGARVRWRRSVLLRRRRQRQGEEPFAVPKRGLGGGTATRKFPATPFIRARESHSGPLRAVASGGLTPWRRYVERAVRADRAIASSFETNLQFLQVSNLLGDSRNGLALRRTK